MPVAQGNRTINLWFGRENTSLKGHILSLKSHWRDNEENWREWGAG